MNDTFEIIARSSIVYIVIVVSLRILGRQHLSQLTISDFVLALLISNAVQNAMVGDDTTLIGGITAALTLIVINFILSQLIFRSTKIRKILSGEQIILIYDGVYQEENLRKVKITHDEMESILREHGAENESLIHLAILETDGSISIINSNESNPEVHKKERKDIQEKK